ncbi:hypothetical protein [Flavobacterium soli]|uniref:hypothetical protein n=1 Tax=Flavobacterium soli TaxID=344881 RepID=UPI0004053492|nr:hypothetical protein [Flavobacterium soli]
MRYTIILFFLTLFSARAQQHCGYDFSSYIVMHIHEDGKSENISNLKVTLVDSLGNDVINVNNKYSWNKSGQIMKFYENYRIDDAGKKIENTPENQKARWFFPFAKDTYLLSVTNDFPADQMRVKIEDVSENPQYETEIIQLYAFNMYVLCTTQVQQKAQQFGPRANKPVNVVLKKK